MPDTIGDSLERKKLPKSEQRASYPCPVNPSQLQVVSGLVIKLQIHLLIHSQSPDRVEKDADKHDNQDRRAYREQAQEYKCSLYRQRTCWAYFWISTIKQMRQTMGDSVPVISPFRCCAVAMHKPPMTAYTIPFAMKPILPSQLTIKRWRGLTPLGVWKVLFQCLQNQRNENLGMFFLRGSCGSCSSPVDLLLVKACSAGLLFSCCWFSGTGTAAKEEVPGSIVLLMGRTTADGFLWISMLIVLQDFK